MPNPALAPSIISGTANLGSSIVNYFAQKKQNELDWAHQQEMYNRQRADAQTDWQLQNTYNSPQEQMNRLRQAGLNPNLVYGKGADNTAMAVRSSSNTPQSQIAPKIDLSGISQGFAQYYNLKQQMATTDNLYQAKQNMIKEGLLTDAKTANTIGSTAKTGFDLSQAQALKDNVIKQAELNNQLTSAQTLNTSANTEATKQGMTVQLQKLEMEKLTNTTNVAKTLQDIYSSKLQNTKVPLEKDLLQEQINNLKKVQESTELENQLKQLDINLRKQGINPNDPTYVRIIAQWLNKAGTASPEEMSDYLKEILTNPYEATEQH